MSGAARTLVVDVGGTAIKAGVLDANGDATSELISVPTKYPVHPAALVDAIVALSEPLGGYERVSIAFPGMVRHDVVLWAPRFSTPLGPGSPSDPALVEEWREFGLAAAVSAVLGVPVRVANDADVHAAAVVAGAGVELLITLGTDVGTSLFRDGRAQPQLRVAHRELKEGQTFSEFLGAAGRVRAGDESWNGSVREAVESLHRLTNFDVCYVGGGNARFVSTVGWDRHVEIVDGTAGILGGIYLWEQSRIVIGDPESAAVGDLAPGVRAPTLIPDPTRPR